MAGAAGSDTYRVDDAGDTATEFAGQGTDKVEASVSFVLGAAVENLTLVGSGAIDGTGNEAANGAERLFHLPTRIARGSATFGWG